MMFSRATSTALAVTILVASLTLACQTESAENEADVGTGLEEIGGEVSGDIAVLAHRLVFSYMSGKTWGFFGATCEKWIEMDYDWEKSISVQLPDDRVKVTYNLQPERLLGPGQLIFYVDVDTGEVEGDNEPADGRSGIAEGCDKW